MPLLFKIIIEIYIYNIRLNISNNDTLLTDYLLSNQLLSLIERMIMQSDVRDIYHAAELNEYRSMQFKQDHNQQNYVVNFILKVRKGSYR